MNLNNIDLNKLTVFSRVVEAGNYRRASEILNVTPSALSQTIGSLEHSLGVTLFHRLGRRLVLTEEGKNIDREFRQYYSSFLDSLARIDRERRQISGWLRIGAYLEFARFQLAPVLASFQKRHPQVQIKLTFETPSRLHELLESDRLDACFSIFPERDRRLIESKPIYREELLLIAPPGLLSEKPSFQEVISAPMVDYYLNHQPIRRWLYLHYRRKPKQLPLRTFAATAEMVLALVNEKMGIGVVPGYLLEGSTGPFTVCRPTPRRLIDHIWMLRLKKRNPSPALDLFTKAVEASFRPVP